MDGEEETREERITDKRDQTVLVHGQILEKY